MSFFIALSAVAVMLLYAVPGFLLVKTKTVSENHISSFSKLLLYVCQPCLTLYSFRKIEFSYEASVNLLICFFFSMAFQLIVIFFFFFIFKNKRNDVMYRIICLASVFSNCGFMGVPLLEELLPNHPEAIAYSSVFSLSMNIIAWSAGLYIISLNRKYIHFKKIFINPSTISLLVTLPFFIFSIHIPDKLDGMITLLARMSTPLCMIIVGMRLGTVSFKSIFSDARQYLAAFLNQILSPLIMMFVLMMLPLDPILEATMIILLSCPVAALVQNLTELLGEGQDKAANTVLLSTLLSVMTIPIISLLL